MEIQQLPPGTLADIDLKRDAERHPCRRHSQGNDSGGASRNSRPASHFPSTVKASSALPLWPMVEPPELTYSVPPATTCPWPSTEPP